MTLPFEEWLPKQRWYAGRARVLERVTPSVVTVLAPDLEHVLLEAAYTDGGTEVYQMFVGWDLELAEEFVGQATIGVQDGRTGCDALFSEDAARRLLAFIQAGTVVDDLRFVPEPGGEFATDLPARVIEGEQSNSSVIFDSQAILKVFRRVISGQNPDVELNRVLARAASPHIAPLLGAIESVAGDGGPTSLAMVTAYAPNSADGWSMAIASVRDLLAEADLHADEVGGDFASEAFRLGEAVAEVHATLAIELGTSTQPAPLAEMRQRLDRSVAEVPELAGVEAAVLERLRVLDGPVTVQRIHGDLHLGQVLRTPDHWFLIDFEGEPGQPAQERRRPDSPMRDVAGMLRSFDYAANQLLVNEPDDEQLAYRAREWVQRNRGAFCDGYGSISGVDPRAMPGVLGAYELDKAVYEAAYEARHRPDWLWIPLKAIRELLDTPDQPAA
ncbi:maltokinase N-terminal cap-like domain-containing protein [Rugosimonospora africana]|uniref:Maltokinase n=1 Tax=Rugosimonospora africana TaxID=556532 RepID=A0A8J3QW19_9ACTN|nr:phosphotransferase [Rugosimonospora africana]GIH17092.1 maltokinase [Rugosimonospora africana]